MISAPNALKNLWEKLKAARKGKKEEKKDDKKAETKPTETTPAATEPAKTTTAAAAAPDGKSLCPKSMLLSMLIESS